MANEPKVLNVNNYQTTTEKVSGGQGTSSATVLSAPKELQKSEQSQVGVDLTNVKGTATGNTEERSLKVSKDATVGSYVRDNNRAGDPGRTKRNIVNTVTVEDVKALIKKYGGGDSYSKEQIDEMLATIREGQYVEVDTTEYPTLEDFLASEGEQGTVYLYPVGNEENNYYQYIWEVSEWVSLGTTALDLSNMATTDTDQTFTGQKTMTLPFYFKFGNYEFEISDGGFGQLFFGRKGTTNGILLDGGTLRSLGSTPKSTNNYDLGSSGLKWNYCWTNRIETKVINAYDAYLGIYMLGTEKYSFTNSCFRSLTPLDLGDRTHAFKDLYASGKFNPNASNYGLTLPDTSGFTANSELLDSASNQNISGAKSFANRTLRIQDGSNPYWSFDSGASYLDIGSYYSGAFIVAMSLTQTEIITKVRFRPNNDNDKELGTSSQRWKDLYLAGNLSDGTNSVTIADLKALIDYAKAQGWIS